MKTTKTNDWMMGVAGRRIIRAVGLFLLVLTIGFFALRSLFSLIFFDAFVVIIAIASVLTYFFATIEKG